jgi:hypothetical protein
MNGSPGIIPEGYKQARKTGPEDAARESRNADDLPTSRPAGDFTPNRTLSLKTGPSVGSSIGEVKKSQVLYAGLLRPPVAADGAR